MTSDPDRSQAFYGELFGWKVDDPGPDYGGYKNFLKDDVQVAGFMGNDGSRRPRRLVDLPRHRRHAGDRGQGDRRGAQVYVAPMQVMELGTMAVIAGPGSASIGIWQPDEFTGLRCRRPSPARRRGSSCTPATTTTVLSSIGTSSGGRPTPRATRRSSATRHSARARPGGGHHGRDRVPARGRPRALVGLLQRRERGGDVGEGRAARRLDRRAGGGHAVRRAGPRRDPTGARFKLQQPG